MWKMLEKERKKVLAENVDADGEGVVVQPLKKRKVEGGSSESSSSSSPSSSSLRFQYTFFPSLLDEFFSVLSTIKSGGMSLQIRFCELFLIFIRDILSQIPTRRFCRIVLVYGYHFFPRYSESLSSITATLTN
jgi:hypothetical protein